MTDNVALVTGGSRGLGRAISQRLAHDGFSVVVNYHARAADADAVVAAIHSAGGTALAVQADVSQSADVRAMFQQVIDRYGRVDVLVNNTGIAFMRTTVAVSEDEWDRVLAVNLKSAFLCSQAAIPMMQQQGGGRIIHISSIAGQTGGRIAPHYAASKAGMLGLTYFMARELGPDNITVNAVAPAGIPTDMLRELGLGGSSARPIPRAGTPEEVAAAVSFLASEEAGFITGEVISVSGGAFIG